MGIWDTNPFLLSVRNYNNLSCVIYTGENDTICSIVGVPQANEQTRKRKRKIVYKAPVDEGLFYTLREIGFMSLYPPQNLKQRQEEIWHAKTTSF